MVGYPQHIFMKKEIIIGTDTLLTMARQLYNKGEITKQQLRTMELRNNNIQEDYKKDIVILKN